jgi:hypothetical protein
MGCVASVQREDAETRAKKRDVRVMKATFPLALLEQYEVEESQAYDRYGGTFQVVNKDDMSTTMGDGGAVNVGGRSRIRSRRNSFRRKST